jgi:hypothetical protein
MNTILLNPQTWDLLVDGSRNIAVAQPPYALAQDAASAIKYFQGDDYYNVNAGIPYWQNVLGHWPPVSLMKTYFVKAALTVPGVVQAQVFIGAIVDRIVGAPVPSGQVQITDVNGALSTVGF